MSLAFVVTIPYKGIFLKWHILFFNPVASPLEFSWKQPLICWEPEQQRAYIDEGGGFPLCYAYPKECLKIRQKAIQNEIKDPSFFTKQTIEILLKNPWPFISYKAPYFKKIWMENYDKNVSSWWNIIYLFLAPIPFLMFLFRRKTYEFSLMTLNMCVLLGTSIPLLFSHIEVRHFYLYKATICLSFILLLPSVVDLVIKHIKKQRD